MPHDRSGQFPRNVRYVAEAERVEEAREGGAEAGRTGSGGGAEAERTGSEGGADAAGRARPWRRSEHSDVRNRYEGR
jgi:hypothetical protein